MRSFCVLVLTIVPALCAAEKNVGTWKLLPSRSIGLGDTAGRIMKISQTGPNRFHYEFETRTKDGKVNRTTEDRVCDAKEHTWETDPAVSHTCTIGHTVFKRNGKPYLEYTGTYSPDGKTLANKIRRWDADGKALPDGLNFFERQ